MRARHLFFLLGLLILVSCKKDDKATLGGDPSPIGALNNTFNISVVPGVQNFTAKVTAIDGDISTVTYTATLAGSTATTILSALSGATLTGNSFTRISRYKITTEGIQSVYDDGNIILVKYDAKVGDEWSGKVGEFEIKREVTSVSETDDYSWNSMLIKVIKIQETGRGLPGVYKIDFIANHKYGLVGIVVELEDGSTQEISVISTNTNP
ncbi:MAG: hypothetical protein AB9842_04230 [Bacteroidales bacterium]